MSMQKGMSSVTKWIIGIVVVAAVVGGLVLLGQMQDNAGNKAPSTVSEVTAEDHQMGKLDSAVTLLEYSDFQCPACKSYQPLVEQAVKEYGDRIRFVYRHFPIYSKHPNAENGGRAAEAAAKQGKFFEYGSVLFTNQDEWSVMNDPTDKLAEYAKALGLNEDQFRADYKDKASKAAVTADYQSGVKAGVNGTPTFFLNGQMVQSPGSYTALKKLIDDALAAAAAPADTSTSPETK
jgi:protein-disulfide isomerase